MILRRPLLTRLCPLLAWLAAAVAGQATEHAAPEPATHEPEHRPLEAGSLRAVAEAPAPAGAIDTPISSQMTSPAEKTERPAAAVKPESPARAGEGGREEIIGLQNLGTSLTERGDWDAAEIAFRQIMAAPRANGEDLASALLGLARVYRKHGEFTKAAAIYERFLKDYPTDERVPDALLEAGRTHRALGAYQLAFARFYSVINSTLKLSSAGFEHYQLLAKTAQFEIAETHFQQGNFAEANKFFSRLRLLELAPTDRARAHFKSAYSLYLGNDFDGAVTALHSYLEQWPQDENLPEARYLLSVSLRSLGRKQEALDATLDLLRVEQAKEDPKRWSYWQRRTGNQLANDFFQNGDTLNALVIYQRLAVLSDEPAWYVPVNYQMALCYERMRLYDRAAAAYQSVVDGANPPATAKPAEPAKPAGPELAELARMAAWRLGQLGWHKQTEQQLSGIFTGTAGPALPALPESHPLAPNIENNAPSKPASPVVHDQPGNPPKTPASL